MGLSRNLVLTAEICSGLRRALTCDCHRRAFCLYRFSFLLLSVTGALPPYPHELFVEKQVENKFSTTKNFYFCFNERSRRQATYARARVSGLHLTDNANSSQVQPTYKRERKSEYPNCRTSQPWPSLSRHTMEGSGIPLKVLVLTIVYSAMSSNTSLSPSFSGKSKE